MSDQAVGMEVAKSRWENAWSQDTDTESEVPPAVSTESDDTSIEFTSEEIREFVEEFDEMAAEALEISEHPTFSKFLGRLTVPVVQKYSDRVENAPEIIAVLGWGLYIWLLYMEWAAKQSASEDESPDVERVKDL